jgi:integrase
MAASGENHVAIDRRLCKRAGVEGVRLHDLRHFVATELLAAGYSVTSVAGRLGNSPGVLLGRYAHFVSASDEDQARHMARALDHEAKHR